MLRLVAYSQDGVHRFPIHPGELVIGSEPSSDIHLPYTGVARQHARLSLRNGELRIQDLGSRKGVLVNGERVKEASLEVLDEIRLGAVTLLVEDSVERIPPTPEAPPLKPPRARITEERMLGHLAGVSDWVVGDAESQTTLESLINDLVVDFGGGVLFLFLGEVDNPAIKFAVASEGAWLGGGEGLVEQVRERMARSPGQATEGSFRGELAGRAATVYYAQTTALERTYLLAGAFPRIRAEKLPWNPVPSFRTLVTLLVMGLVHHMGRYEPIMPGQRGQADLKLAPGLTVGESPAMKRLMDQLRAAVDTSASVLLVGEPGTGKELLARTLHLSGSSRKGPFITALGSGASDEQVEADLFGAEVRGKEGPIRREGKLALADGGTLFLDDVEGLSLDLQARLVRFLRSGEAEAKGSRSAREVDVRLVAGSAGDLESRVGRGEFRVDLAHRLSQLAIRVPSVRERREELPLLIQSHFNRFCHETGKRVQGITVKAMSALVAYDYPGNLIELENVARQLVYLCPPGQPIDVHHLPELIKLGKIKAAASVDAQSELELSHLVAACEQAAIREALRRTAGNKSQAARLLGLSRNGLAMKMRRYRIGT